jgi:two-component SAPR family response regulator
LLSSIDFIRVLVVDDESAIADSLAAILRNHGLDALPEYSARGAALASEKFKPDVLISDIVMPGASGVELAEWFSKAHPACRIILTSSSRIYFDASCLSFEHSQEITFVPKPVRISELLELLELLTRRNPAA